MEFTVRSRLNFGCITLGSITAWLQSILGNISAHSVFAYLQSTAMGGYRVARIIQAWGMISRATIMIYTRRRL